MIFRLTRRAAVRNNGGTCTWSCGCLPSLARPAGAAVDHPPRVSGPGHGRLDGSSPQRTAAGGPVGGVTAAASSSWGRRRTVWGGKLGSAPRSALWGSASRRRLGRADVGVLAVAAGADAYDAGGGHPALAELVVPVRHVRRLR